jgi:hypothetical protein
MTLFVLKCVALQGKKWPRQATRPHSGAVSHRRWLAKELTTADQYGHGMQSAYQNFRMVNQTRVQGTAIMIKLRPAIT